MDMGGKLKLDYKELTISILDDGRILARAHGTDEYYIVKDGVTQGPYKSGDPKIADFEAPADNSKSAESLLLKKTNPISAGPVKIPDKIWWKKLRPVCPDQQLPQLQKSKDKFAAMVIENIVVNEDQGKKMDEAIRNAKTEQEKIDLAMKYAQEMQQKMIAGRRTR